MIVPSDEAQEARGLVSKYTQCRTNAEQRHRSGLQQVNATVLQYMQKRPRHCGCTQGGCTTLDVLSLQSARQERRPTGLRPIKQILCSAESAVSSGTASCGLQTLKNIQMKLNGSGA